VGEDKRRQEVLRRQELRGAVEEARGERTSSEVALSPLSSLLSPSPLLPNSQHLFVTLCSAGTYHLRSEVICGSNDKSKLAAS